MRDALKLLRMRTWLVLCLSLVLMQTLGLAHRVVHAKVGWTTAVAHASEVSDGLWGEHHQTSDCQQFDQSCGDALQHTVALMAALPVLPVWQASAWSACLTTFKRLYAARAPPVFLD